MPATPIPKSLLHSEGFLAWSWEPGKKPVCRHSLFANLLSATVYPPLAPSILTLLEGQVSKAGSYNYWVRSSPDAAAEPYPDDLDDTACATGLLAQAGVLTPPQKARFVKLLISLEEAPGGPYRTWCTHDPAWHDVDPVVNANVAWALVQCRVTLPTLTAYLEQQWEKDACSPYYPNQWVARYLLVRTLPSLVVLPLLTQRLQSDPPTTPLSRAAAALCARHAHLPVTFPSERARLEPLITERAGPVPRYSGSRVASTAWYRASRVSVPPPTHRSYPAYSRFRRMLLTCSPLLAEPLFPFLSRLERVDRTGSLAGVARGFARVASPATPERILRQLEEATIWGWLAYTLADGILDQVLPAAQLPTVQWATRQAAAAFERAAGASFRPVIERLFTRVDVANSWEQRYARLSAPSREPFPPLSERSCAHVLGPLAVLAPTSAARRQAALLEAYIMAYLTLRQHLDDAHDWREDHERGIRTAIGDAVRAAASDHSLPALRRAFETVGVRYVLRQGARYERALSRARAALPPAWQPFLATECGELAAALDRFRYAVQFVRELREAA